MTNKRIQIITFSAGGSTRDVADAAHVLLTSAGYTADTLDITSAEERRTASNLQFHADLLLAVFPVWFGDLPEPVTGFLSSAELVAPRAALILCYGSCGVGDTPARVRGLLSRHSVPLYRVMTVPSAHTFAPYAKTVQPLPDSLSAVGKFILDAAAEDAPVGSEPLPVLPRGSLFSRLLHGPALNRLCASVPDTDVSKCVFCDRCSEVCPTDALVTGKTVIDADACLRCGACVGVCPEGAKSQKFNPLYLSYLNRRLAEKKLPREITGTAK